MNKLKESEEKLKEDQDKLNKMKQMLDYLYDIDLIDYIFDGELSFNLFNEIDIKYLVDIDQDSFSDDSEEVKAIKSQGIEWFGENYGLSIRDGEFFLLSLDILIGDVKYWYISKIKTNDLEKARKIAYMLNLLENIESLRIKKPVRQLHLSNSLFSNN